MPQAFSMSIDPQKNKQNVTEMEVAENLRERSFG